ncbi:MAG: TetR/AcrR family transcriptional regulator [Acidobacteriota bacterium]
MKRDFSYPEKAENILKVAAKIIARDGYENATIRKVARELNLNLATLYYYFKSKDELLYAIQYQTFDSLLSNLKKKLKDVEDGEKKLYIIIENHLSYFLTHLNEIKVCTHELETLTGKYYKEVESKRKEYFKIVLEILNQIKEKYSIKEKNLRVSTLCLFGMLNWFYTWYDPNKDLKGKELVEHVKELFLNGFIGRSKNVRKI